VTLTIYDGRGEIVRTFSSDDVPEHLPAEQYFDERWLGKEKQAQGEWRNASGLSGICAPRPPALEYGYSIAAVWQEGTPLEPRAPWCSRVTIELLSKWR